MANTLFLRLEGPLQSWGERARWSVRDTAPEPTKSGVVGLLGCALGLDADDDLRELSQAIRLGVRCDRPGQLLVDYHTVVGGVMSADGKIKINSNTKQPETVVSWRSYLQDASFLVAVQASEDWVARLAAAVQNPVWPIFLGRKSCPPARPVFEGVDRYATLEEALCRPCGPGLKGVRAVVECSPQQGVLRRDELDCRSRRTFLPRYIREFKLDVPAAMEGS